MNKGTHNGGFHHGEHQRKTIKSRNFEQGFDAMDKLFDVNVWRPAFRRFWHKRGMEVPATERFATHEN